MFFIPFVSFSSAIFNFIQFALFMRWQVEEINKAIYKRGNVEKIPFGKIQIKELKKYIFSIYKNSFYFFTFSSSRLHS
jgi:hypothetical protein